MNKKNDPGGYATKEKIFVLIKTLREVEKIAFPHTHTHTQCYYEKENKARNTFLVN